MLGALKNSAKLAVQNSMRRSAWRASHRSASISSSNDSSGTSHDSKCPHSGCRRRSASTSKRSILEDWIDNLQSGGIDASTATGLFDAFIRAELGAGRTLQKDLRDPQRRASVRQACQVEARRIMHES